MTILDTNKKLRYAYEFLSFSLELSGNLLSLCHFNSHKFLHIISVQIDSCSRMSLGSPLIPV